MKRIVLWDKYTIVFIITKKNNKFFILEIMSEIFFLIIYFSLDIFHSNGTNQVSVPKLKSDRKSFRKFNPGETGLLRKRSLMKFKAISMRLMPG